MLNLTFQAVLLDGGFLNEPDDFDNIEIFRHPLREFRLLREDGGVHFSMKLGKGKRLIYRRRPTAQVTIAMGGPDGPEVVDQQMNCGPITWIVGWQETIKEVKPDGKNVQFTMFINSDGTVRAFDRLPKGQGFNLTETELEHGLVKDGISDEPEPQG